MLGLHVVVGLIKFHRAKGPTCYRMFRPAFDVKYHVSSIKEHDMNNVYTNKFQNIEKSPSKMFCVIM